MKHDFEEKKKDKNIILYIEKNRKYAQKYNFVKDEISI